MYLSAQVEVGSGFGQDKHNTRPADVLVLNWSLGKPAAFDLTVTSPQTPSILSEVGVMAGSAALVGVMAGSAALVGVMAGSAALVGVMTGSAALVGVMAGSAALVGVMAGSAALVGVMAGSAALVGVMAGSAALVGVMAGSAALVEECHKHDLNYPKCSELDWKCRPLAVETYGCWPVLGC